MTDRLTDRIAKLADAEDGHGYYWGGGSLLAIIILVLLLVWLL